MCSVHHDKAIRGAVSHTEILRTVADALGRYYALVPNGRYVVEVSKKNSDESYVPVYTSPVLAVSKGIIAQRWRV